MTDTVDTVDTPTCNTNKGGSVRSRTWVFTWNNYTDEEFNSLTQLTQELCSDFAYQKEIGKENGTPHIQGALYFKNARSFKSVKELLPKCHLEPAKNWIAAKKYCMKDDTAAGGRNAKNRIVVKDPLEGKELRPFQREIMDLITEEPDDRTIHWYWEPNGNVGKTVLAKSICLKYPGEAIYVCGKAADMKYGIAQMVEKGHHPRIVIIDLTRTTENYTGSLYQGLEEIKNGIFFSSKYESGMIMFNSPHVICLANWEPNRENLSGDRWKITKLE